MVKIVRLEEVNGLLRIETSFSDIVLFDESHGVKSNSCSDKIISINCGVSSVQGKAYHPSSCKAESLPSQTSQSIVSRSRSASKHPQPEW